MPLPFFSSALTYTATATATIVTATMTAPSASQPPLTSEIRATVKKGDWPKSLTTSEIKEPDQIGMRDHQTENGQLMNKAQTGQDTKERRQVSLDSEFKMHNNIDSKTQLNTTKPPPPLPSKPHLSKVHMHVETGHIVQSLHRQAMMDHELGGVKTVLDQRLNSPLSDMKASIINELSNKLQGLGSWQSQGSPQAQRSVALIPKRVWCSYAGTSTLESSTLLGTPVLSVHVSEFSYNHHTDGVGMNE